MLIIHNVSKSLLKSLSFCINKSKKLNQIFYIFFEKNYDQVLSFFKILVIYFFDFKIYIINI